jgi:hypothetical protein
VKAAVFQTAVQAAFMLCGTAAFMRCFRRMMNFMRPLLSAELAAGLISLTQLVLSGCPVHTLRHVSSRVALRSLHTGCAVGAEEELGQAEWAAVGRLTGLTELQLWNTDFLSASPECCAAVNSLSRLQVAAAGWWSAEVLPAFSNCTRLTEICGCWRSQGDVAEGVVLPSVVSLSRAAVAPPLAVFPNLTAIEQGDCLSVQTFGSIAQHCTGLTKLAVDDYPRGFTSLPEPGISDATPFARMGAVKSLSALTRLTRLGFMPQDNTELAVLVHVAADLLPLGLKRLELLLLHNSPYLSVGALMHLGKLRGLEALSLKLLAARVIVGVLGEPDLFLMALSDITRVGLVLKRQEDVDIVEAAWARLRESGLPCPREVDFSITQ